MKKKSTTLALVTAVLFALLQLTNPARTNPPAKADFIATLHPPGPIAATLSTACYDCHSDETKWPWYSHVAPISWLIASDVNGGRRHLNLSEWPVDDAKRAEHRLEEMSYQIGNGFMPPKKYTAIHAGARLTDSQRSTLTDWLDAEGDKLSPPAK